jgi:ATP-binding cassette subfamily C protein
LPQTIETVVGDRGARFSGGERQRLALARALLRQPSLLILDEPTSALDARNEQIILERVEALKGCLTMILVTHRPERVQRADRSLWINGGKLVCLAASGDPSAQASGQV